MIGVFPRLTQFACFHFEFSLANNNISFFMIGRWDYFRFFNPQLKVAPVAKHGQALKRR